MLPIVSVITPTMPGREEYLRQAIACARSQEYPGEIEIIVVTDKPHDIEDGADVATWCDRTLGEKRNRGCAEASGEIIVNFDDDDWSAENRIYSQVALLLETGKQVTGYDSILVNETRPLKVFRGDGFYPASAWWRMHNAGGLAAGTSLCYRRDWWATHPVPAVQCGEDDQFWAEAARAGVAVAVDGGNMICVTNHVGNVSKRSIGGASWEELPGDPRD